MNLKRAIIATLTYHDIFNYPLKLDEIESFLIGKKTSKEQILKSTLELQNSVHSKDGFYFLKNEQYVVDYRLKRKKYSSEKMQKANFFTKLIALIPMVKLIAITGALSMENSSKDDDIDLLIITSPNTLWTTRLFTNIVLMPYKRSPKSKKQKNKACLNIFIDKKDLKIRDQNLYTAHEIAQMKPIYDKDHTYSKFVEANSWVHDYLPNWKPIYVKRLTTSDKISFQKALFLSQLVLVIKTLEALAKWAQLIYMRSKITTEQISDTQLFFHPKKTQERVLNEYKKKLRKISVS